MTLFTKFKILTALLALSLCVQTSRANPDDFTVQAVGATNVFQLSAAKGKYVALHFLLKTECPLCLRHTRDYTTKSAGDARVVHVFIKPDSEEDVKAWASRFDGTPKVTIYRDPNAALARAFGIPDGYRFHGQAVHYPALVLLDTKGKEAFRYVGKSNGDRLSYEKFSAKLEELTRLSPR